MNRENQGSDFDATDIRLSAYALGELEGADRAEIEALLERDPQARAFVAEIREAASALEAELAAETAPPRPVVLRRSRWLVLVPAFAAAALASGAAFLAWSSFHTGENESAETRLQARVAPRNEGVRDLLERRAAPAAASPEAKPAETVLADDPNAVDVLAEIDRPHAETLDLATNPPPVRKAEPEALFFGRRGFGGGGPGQPGGSGKNLGGKVTGLSAIGYAAGGEVERVELVEEEMQSVEATKSKRSDGFNTEAYSAIVENAFKAASDDPMSTFSIDVDTASYANARRYLQSGALPPPASVRIEEFINYFRYADPAPDGGEPFSVATEVASCPWNRAHRLVRVGLKGKAIDWSKRKPANLVFLIDVSGSMNEPNKLPLLQRSFAMLIEQLQENDRVAIVVYAGASGLVLPSTPGAQRGAIASAVERLQAGGSTNGGAGIELAYKVAQDNFVKDGINRVILATDGDFNVGTTDQGSLQALIEEKRKSGVFLSVLGFGEGNLKDSTMELLADQGNGNYAYIDSLREAKKVFVEQCGGTLVPIAKDVKIQVEFNPQEVQAWRLVGYENRVLAHQDFNDDKKDAGEIGSGLSVTALYEVVPSGVKLDVPSVDPKRYAATVQPNGQAFSGELMFLKLRYKEPDGEVSKLIETPVKDGKGEFAGASESFRFSAAVAGFAMLLKKSAFAGDLNYGTVEAIAAAARGDDPDGHRAEFLELVRAANRLGDEKSQLQEIGYGGKK